MFGPKALSAKQAALLGVAAWVSAALPGTALARSPATTTAPGLTCADPPIEQPFTGFGDSRDYTLAPGADFEDRSAPGWHLRNGAAIVNGNEPFRVRGPDDEASLAIPSGGSATSPVMCVDERYPIFRFFARVAQRGAALKVRVIQPTQDGFEASTTAALSRTSPSSWFLTDDLPLVTATSAIAPGGRLVAFRFTAKGQSGSWRIDDVYVDPRCH